MESCIEHAHLRNRWKNSRNSLDSKNVCRVMKRSEYRALLKLSDHLVCDELAAYEFLCSMNNTMAYSLNILESSKNAVFLVKESIHDSSDSYCMILDRHFPHEFLLSGRLTPAKVGGKQNIISPKMYLL